MKTFILIVSLSLILAQWELVSEDLMSLSVSATKWNFENSCDWVGGTTGSSSNIGNCSPVNDLSYIITGSGQRAYYSIQNLPPHYQAKVIVDGFFLDAQNSMFQVTFDVQGSSSTQTFSYSQKICNYFYFLLKSFSRKIQFLIIYQISSQKIIAQWYKYKLKGLIISTTLFLLKFCKIIRTLSRQALIFSHYQSKIKFLLYINLLNKNIIPAQIITYQNPWFLYSKQANQNIYLLYDDHIPDHSNNCKTSWHNFQINTFILTFTHNDYNALAFRICTTNFASKKFGLRNFQIYVNRCHWSCLTCETGSQYNKCRTCYTNPSTTLGTLGTCSACPTNKAFIEYLDGTIMACQTECLYYRVPDSNKVCQFNENMLPLNTYFDSATFTLTTPWGFQPDPINTNIINPTKIASIPCYTSNKYVGPFYYNEGYQLQLTLPNIISYIRFRVTILKFGSWPDLTSVYVYFDNIQMVTVYSISDVLYDKNAQNLYSDKNCTSPIVTYYRIETKFYTNAMLQIKLSLSLSLFTKERQIYIVGVPFSFCKYISFAEANLLLQSKIKKYFLLEID